MMYDGGNGGMFGGLYGGNVNAIPGMGWGGYQAPAPTPLPASAQPKPDYGSRFGAPTWPLRNPPQYPQIPGGQPDYRLGGLAPRYAPDPGNPNAVNLSGFGQPMMAPEYGGRTMDAPAPQQGGGMFSAPGFMSYQRAQPTQPIQPMQPPQGQSFEQFAQTLGNSGMTSGQISDLYAKQQAQAQSAPAPTNFWGNVGPGGTRNPYPQNPNWTPPQWGRQTYDFDPRAMAGKQVTGDMGWYYGRDAIGRTIGQDGTAMANFSRPADGFQRTRPWFA